MEPLDNANYSLEHLNDNGEPWGGAQLVNNNTNTVAYGDYIEPKFSSKLHDVYPNKFKLDGTKNSDGTITITNSHNNKVTVRPAGQSSTLKSYNCSVS